MKLLGLDIGTNSLGSAWVDDDKELIITGDSIFPAGVEESDTKRGAPKNQKRRQARSQRRSIRRRAQRKAALRMLLREVGLLPNEGDPFDHKESGEGSDSPWQLRRRGLIKALTAHEFGRVLTHLNQRRGALGVEADDDEDEESGKVKDAIANLYHKIIQRYADDEAHAELLRSDLKEFARWRQREGVTVGRFMADEHDDREQAVKGKPDKRFHGAIRNRRDRFEFHADRKLIHDEFDLNP